MRRIMLLRSAVFTLLVSFYLSGCGKYGTPFPPEALSPRAVADLNVTASTTGLKFTWNAPEDDLRSKELKTLDGYNVYRRELAPREGKSDEPGEFKLVSTIADTHVVERERLRAEARAQNRPSHRIKVDPALTKFEFSDQELTPGKSYVYKIVPYNQGDVEGEVRQVVKVQFRGENSETVIVPYARLEDDFLSNL